MVAGCITIRLVAGSTSPWASLPQATVAHDTRAWRSVKNWRAMTV
jgi:hypothetical protein